MFVARYCFKCAGYKRLCC